MDPLRQTSIIAVEDSSQVAVARRAATAACQQLRLPTQRCNEVEIVTVELANNLLRHAGRGQILLNLFDDDCVLEVLSIDSGPGMTSFAECFSDGFSTGSTPGLGLGAVSRLASRFDAWTWPERGTVLSARFAALDSLAPIEQRAVQEALLRDLPGVVCTALHGEDASGDRWAIATRDGQSLFIMVDGLGHGFFAAEAAEAAVKAFLESNASSPAELIEAIHGPLRGTRGAAAAVAAVDPERGIIRFCGVGNISGSVHGASHPLRKMVSHNGIVGLQMRRVQAFEYAYLPEDLLILHSDGITTHWKPEDYPGLQEAAPAVIAGVLHRDFNRGRDDATVLVTRL